MRVRPTIPPRVGGVAGFAGFGGGPSAAVFGPLAGGWAGEVGGAKPAKPRNPQKDADLLPPHWTMPPPRA